MSAAAITTAVLPSRTVRNEDTGSNSNGGGTDNDQKSTKSSDSNGNRNGNNDSNYDDDENKGGNNSGGRPATAESAAMATATSLAAVAVAWQERGVGSSGQLGGSGGSLARAQHCWWRPAWWRQRLGGGSGLAAAAWQQRQQLGKSAVLAVALLPEQSTIQISVFDNRSSTHGYFLFFYLVNIFTTDRKYRPSIAIQILPSFTS